ncbi:MAG TPA: M1 family metallopeptidase [Flavobacteriales bacterium]|nr:M1 family metallopeptidase [Flavobacteriales bacterium]
MKKATIFVCAGLSIMATCKQSKEVTSTNTTNHTEVVSENSELYDPNYTAEDNAKKNVRPVYQATETRVNNLLHTKLEVSFDFKKRYLNGKATIDLTPHFYPTNKLSLDAKGMDIHKVQLLEGNTKTDLAYTYDTLDLSITLPKTYKKGDKYTVYIEYTAKPDELEAGGSAAITSDKGLYFIDPDENIDGKPTQIWTQGETEASSCWFPTIDRSNQRQTEEILITVPNKFKTLSNGLMVASKTNPDGTRTDHWKMNQPHAPYLVMMAIGEYSVVTDKWKKKNGKEIEVSYYVDPEYEAYARDIFGETPRMLQFFSDRLGVEYAWDKYSQVVVRDYVSGAMENTTATIHGEFLHRTKRELLDGNNESIIAHELFHHWFGDLVTCESWSNLPLNESFANYSQFLWDEYKYGRDEADYQALKEAQGYFASAKQQGYVDMIRFDYGDKEEMFDAHSYNKGGRILNMLRNYVGDDAFFESLRVYLTENMFQPAEIHNLRLAFEKVTGEDLNWFFNEWFLAKGHPELKITQEYDSILNKVYVKVVQQQDLNHVPLYQLPVKIDVYSPANPEGKTHEVVINEREQLFTLECEGGKPLLVNFDADKVLLCEKDDDKPVEQFIVQYYKGKNFLDRYEAIKECSNSSKEAAKKVVLDALDDKFWYLREMAAKSLKRQVAANGEMIKNKLSTMARTAKEASLRSTSIRQLAKYFEGDKSLLPLYEEATNDQSYDVMAEGFAAISKLDPDAGVKLARKNTNEKNSTIRSVVAEILAEYGDVSDHQFFLDAMKKSTGFEKYGMMSLYNGYLKHQPDSEVDKGIAVFEDVARNGNTWWIKLGGYQMLNGLQAHFSKREMEHNALAESLKKDGKTMEATQEEGEAVKCKNQQERINALLVELKSKETDKNLLQYLK